MSGDKEIWKPIPETEGQLEASSKGRIRRLMTGWKKPLAEPEIVKPNKVARGYKLVHYSIKEQQWSQLVQNCLLSAFIGPPPSDKHYALFIDGNKKNFKLNNLKWGTAVDRNELRHIHGKYKERLHKMIEGELCYRCIYCRKWKNKDGFYKLKGGVSALGNPLTTCGLTSDCKKCANAMRSERRRAKSAIKPVSSQPQSTSH